MNETLVFNTKKTCHCTLTSSPKQIKRNKETTQDFFFYFFLFPSISFASEVEEHGLFVHSPFKQTMSSLVKKKEEDAKVSENDTLPGTYVGISYCNLPSKKREKTEIWGYCLSFSTPTHVLRKQTSPSDQKVMFRMKIPFCERLAEELRWLYQRLITSECIQGCRNSRWPAGRLWGGSRPKAIHLSAIMPCFCTFPGLGDSHSSNPICWELYSQKDHLHL